jgi:hypothetical protein
MRMVTALSMQRRCAKIHSWRRQEAYGKRNIVRLTDLSKRLQDREHRTDVVNTGVYYTRDRHRVVNTPDHGCILSCPACEMVCRQVQSSSQKAEPSSSNDMHLDVRVRSKNLHRKWSSYNLWTATWTKVHRIAYQWRVHQCNRMCSGAFTKTGNKKKNFREDANKPFCLKKSGDRNGPSRFKQPTWSQFQITYWITNVMLTMILYTSFRRTSPDSGSPRIAIKLASRVRRLVKFDVQTNGLKSVQYARKSRQKNLAYRIGYSI